MKFIPTAVSAKAALAVLKTQKHSPTIMFGAGVVGVVTAAVLASKATLKGAELMAEHKETKTDLEGYHEADAEHYTHEDLVKDKALLALQTSVKIAKLYTPAVLVGAAGIGLLTGSHVVLTKRHAAATAAYAALDKAFRQYRIRVQEHVGEDNEREIYRGVEVEKVTITDENGKRKQVEKKFSTGGSPYSVLYTDINIDGDPNPNWQELPELNVLFLRSIQNQLNNRLQARGYLFLNDAYEELGLPRTKAGQIVGWVKKTDKNETTHKGDGYVDFGIFDDNNLESLLEFATGRNGGVWLDFNVDGNILDLI